MKDAYEVLIQKEAHIARVRHEIECLKIAAALLEKSDESDKPRLVELLASTSRWAEGIVTTLEILRARRISIFFKIKGWAKLDFAKAIVTSLANTLTRGYRSESA